MAGDLNGVAEVFYQFIIKIYNYGHCPDRTVSWGKFPYLTISQNVMRINSNYKENEFLCLTSYL